MKWTGNTIINILSQFMLEKHFKSIPQEILHKLLPNRILSSEECYDAFLYLFQQYPDAMSIGQYDSVKSFHLNIMGYRDVMEKEQVPLNPKTVRIIPISTTNYIFIDDFSKIAMQNGDFIGQRHFFEDWMHGLCPMKEFEDYCIGRRIQLGNDYFLKTSQLLDMGCHQTIPIRSPTDTECIPSSVAYAQIIQYITLDLDIFGGLSTTDYGKFRRIMEILPRFFQPEATSRYFIDTILVKKLKSYFSKMFSPLIQNKTNPKLEDLNILKISFEGIRRILAKTWPFLTNFESFSAAIELAYANKQCCPVSLEKSNYQKMWKLRNEAVNIMICAEFPELAYFCHNNGMCFNFNFCLLQLDSMKMYIPQRKYSHCDNFLQYCPYFVKYRVDGREIRKGVKTRKRDVEEAMTQKKITEMNQNAKKVSIRKYGVMDNPVDQLVKLLDDSPDYFLNRLDEQLDYDQKSEENQDLLKVELKNVIYEVAVLTESSTTIDSNTTENLKSGQEVVVRPTRKLLKRSRSLSRIESLLTVNNRYCEVDQMSELEELKSLTYELLDGMKEMLRMYNMEKNK